jgi:hypothetical protein
MHGPTCTFWANLTPFSLQTKDQTVPGLHPPADQARPARARLGISAARMRARLKQPLLPGFMLSLDLPALSCRGGWQDSAGRPRPVDPRPR